MSNSTFSAAHVIYGLNYVSELSPPVPYAFPLFAIRIVLTFLSLSGAAPTSPGSDSLEVEPARSAHSFSPVLLLADFALSASLFVCLRAFLVKWMQRPAR